MLKEGLKHQSIMSITAGNTAEFIGSGDMAVLATPAMVALMENAAMNAVAPALPQGSTTVGAEMNTTHIKPSAIGAKVRAVATLTAVEGRKLTFDVEACDEVGAIGKGTHVRFVVDKERFMAKLR